ncbi:uncharacterized mitochondrial protein AtMg00810-like [Alnus glutinosa]|uniref:uncharacterized mitochondrial protein AtMg00810-like n=1 Tax=Alnus glutinosa TaxID=3517 RepID=UPI002D776D39|nr:uncharacterized mitochondrial protein AtMg00810-like [Alnus glutinosa]
MIPLLSWSSNCVSVCILKMKDLGTLTYFLGLEISSSCDNYYLTQAKYISDLLSRANLTDCKTIDTPTELNVCLNLHDGESLCDFTLYQHLAGNLVYLTVSRPDISYVVHKVSQFMAAPCSTHFSAVLGILHYLKETLFHGLHFFSQFSLQLHAFIDVDWVDDSTNRHSTTDYCSLLGTSLISWQSKKQSISARSNTERQGSSLKPYKNFLLAEAPQELPVLWPLRDLPERPNENETHPACESHKTIGQASTI